MTPFLLLGLACACARERPQGELIEGEAAGAGFRVRLATRVPEGERAEVKRIVSDAIGEVASRASSSVPESDLARLERADSGEEVSLSADTFEILREAARVNGLTGGAFDVTVIPLSRLWGFGPGGSAASSPPTEEQIERARARVGIGNLVLDDDSMAVTKRIDSLELDLSGVATGYALDRAAAALEERGYRDYLIEAEAVVKSRGKDAAGEPWRVGIWKPGAGGGELQRTVPLSGFSMATAGDFRGTDDADGLLGKLHAHLVDPRTGRPLDHDLLSATVLGESCLTAESLALGLLVLGPEEGYRLASAEGLAVLFLVRAESGGFEERATPAFAELFF
jgi:thiamine biosynthesis lipoprotein